MLNPCILSLLRLKLHDTAKQIFVGKSVVLHLLEGPELTTERMEKRKSPAPDWIQTHDLSVKRRTLYRCALYRFATTAAPWEIDS